MVFLRTLLGKNNLEFSVACLKTCIENCTEETVLEVFEDGSLTPELGEYIKEQIPNAVIVYKIERDKVLDQILKDYPMSLALRQSNVFGYKLFDTMLYEPKPFFYIDTDIVFYRKFRFPETGSNPIFMMDSENAYCFSNKKLYSINKQLLKNINAGFYYFPGSLFKLNVVEELLHKYYDADILSHHWAEQTVWNILAFLNKPAFYFNNKQIVMASPVIRLHKNLIAIHFSRPYRNKMNDIKKKMEKLTDNNVEAIIELMPARNFSFMFFMMTKYYNKVLRRVTRTTRMTHK